ncbi:arylsulfatase [Citrobacter sp. NCU1]|nr:arylsulfatase [Citrobacter sp. NCU1]NDO82194.1 arylsulfatase [Citrobacter sp. NCU1]
MDCIYQQYPGYSRFAKWMARLALGIIDDVIEVPKEQ